eukprot:5919-Heterococcus_DN1.PRE.2
MHSSLLLEAYIQPNVWHQYKARDKAYINKGDGVSAQYDACVAVVSAAMMSVIGTTPRLTSSAMALHSSHGKQLASATTTTISGV